VLSCHAQMSAHFMGHVSTEHASAPRNSEGLIARCLHASMIAHMLDSATMGCAIAILGLRGRIVPSKCVQTSALVTDCALRTT